MTLMDLLTRYKEDPHLKRFRKLFPRMYEFAGEVEVIPWQDEYALGDVNPEVVDEVRFYEELFKSGLMSEEEYQDKLKSIPSYASKTLAVAFTEEKKVSFREKAPSLSVILHELGHVYFREPDPVWSAVYGGGERLMWLILEGKAKGGEEAINRWHSLMRLAYESPEEALSALDEATLKVGRRLGVDFLRTDFPPNVPRRPIYGLMLWSGTVPSRNVQSVLVNVLEGVRWNEYLHAELLKELTAPSPKKTERVMIRLSPEEKRRWEEEARRRGMTLAEWIREAVRGYLKG